MEHENDSDTIYYWCSLKDRQRLGKPTGIPGNRRMCRDHPICCVVEIGQNTERNPGDLRRFVLTQTSLKDLELMLFKKNGK